MGLQYSYDNLVENEEEAKKLIKYAEQNINGAHTIIEPIDSMHGVIRFYRKIRFDNRVKEQREELIEQLKQSRYMPRLREAQKVHDGRLKWMLKKGQKEEAEKLNKEKAQYLEEVADGAWRDFLKFYQDGEEQDD